MYIVHRYKLFSGEPTTMPLGFTTLEIEEDTIAHLSESPQGVKGVEWGRYHYNAFFGLLTFHKVFTDTCLICRAYQTFITNPFALPAQFTGDQFEEPEYVFNAFFHRTEQDINI